MDVNPLGYWYFQRSRIQTLRDDVGYLRSVYPLFDRLHVLLNARQQGTMTTKIKKESENAQRTCSSNTVTINTDPSLIPTVATSSSLVASPRRASIRTGESRAGVTRPLARVSKAATSLRNQSTADAILDSAFAYSARVSSESNSCLEPGTKDAVDLAFDFEAYVRESGGRQTTFSRKTGRDTWRGLVTVDDLAPVRRATCRTRENDMCFSF